MQAYLGISPSFTTCPCIRAPADASNCSIFRSRTPSSSSLRAACRAAAIAVVEIECWKKFGDLWNVTKRRFSNVLCRLWFRIHQPLCYTASPRAVNSFAMRRYLQCSRYLHPTFDWLEELECDWYILYKALPLHFSRILITNWRLSTKVPGQHNGRNDSLCYCADYVLLKRIVQ